MFVLLPVAAVYSMAAMAMMARGGGRGGRGGRGPPPNPYNELREIISWTVATDEQTNLLKQLLENGQLEGKLPDVIKAQFPPFAQINNKCLSDKISQLKSTKKKAERRIEQSKFLH